LLRVYHKPLRLRGTRELQGWGIVDGASCSPLTKEAPVGMVGKVARVPAWVGHLLQQAIGVEHGDGLPLPLRLLSRVGNLSSEAILAQRDQGLMAVRPRDDDLVGDGAIDRGH